MFRGSGDAHSSNLHNATTFATVNIDFLILGHVPNGKEKSVAIIPRFWFGGRD
jgi:hypothetical protein